MENNQPKTYVETTTETKTIEETPVISQVEGAEPAFYAEICLIATGATLPVRVGGQNAIEVHKAFGDYSVDCMINTFDEYTEKVKNGFGYHEVAEPVRLDWIDVTSIYKEKSIYSISDIPVYVRWQGTEATAVKSVKGSAPERFTIREKINWASERANMNVGYPAFTSWVETDSPFWTGVDPTNQGLYQGYPSPSAGLTFDNSDVDAEHILAVHYTKYDIEQIDGITVEKDGEDADDDNDDDIVVLESGDVLIKSGPITSYTVLDNSLFGGVEPKEGDEIHFYMDYTTNYWQIMTWDNHYGSGNDVPNWGGSNVSNSTANVWGTSHKYIIMNVSSSLANMLKDYGIKIQPDQITIKAIAYKSK